MLPDPLRSYASKKSESARSSSAEVALPHVGSFGFAAVSLAGAVAAFQMEGGLLRRLFATVWPPP